MTNKSKPYTNGYLCHLTVKKTTINEIRTNQFCTENQSQSKFTRNLNANKNMFESSIIKRSML